MRLIAFRRTMRTPCTRDHTADWERYWQRKALQDSLRGVADSTDSGVEL